MIGCSLFVKVEGALDLDFNFFVVQEGEAVFPTFLWHP